ncbi:c-type cytochrome [Pseudomonas sp. BN417]|uniref:c-type cytochrome n=1 Tax=Pseudomonas sp. BN417 TaxID=2567890 RepID=UPI002458AFBA|nr:c-type cytochrome [Pseudomonas sp. BN417]MDH4555417.1 c-type cytochrome [Pseudomonas sp. BN417]
MQERKTGRIAGLATVLALVLTQSALAADCAPAQVEKGAALFGSDCSVCHSAKADGPAMMGPNLHGLYGRTSGSLAGFSYSQAMKAKAVDWQLDSLEQFIAQPQAFVGGTYMPYAGMASADDRRAVGCFLGAQK